MTITAKFNGKCTKCGQWMPAGTTIEWIKGIGGARHVTPADCATATAKAAEPAPSINLKPIADFLAAARTRGLKFPKLRVLAVETPDNTQGGELRLGLTVTGHVPGSISVNDRGAFIGCVRPNGDVTGKLRDLPEVRAHLLAVAADPEQAGKAYAALMGKCSFCSHAIGHGSDRRSVDAGFGPDCAAKWGLKWGGAAALPERAVA